MEDGNLCRVELDEVCKYISGTAKIAGAKYECKVDLNKDAYTFYVLTTPTQADTSINLIMERNICEYGTVATEENTCFIPWISKDDYFAAGGIDREWYNVIEGEIVYGMEIGSTSKGPITSMNFLKEATKNWTNINEIIIDSFDDEAGNHYKMKEYKTYARMPYSNELREAGCSNGFFHVRYGYLII